MNFRLFNTQSRTKEAVRCEKGKNLCKSDTDSLFKEKILRNLKISFTPISKALSPQHYLFLNIRFHISDFASKKSQNRLRHLLPFAPLQQTAGCLFVNTTPLLEVKRYFLRHALVAHVRHPFFPQRSRFRTAFAAQNHPMDTVQR